MSLISLYVIIFVACVLVVSCAVVWKMRKAPAPKAQANPPSPPKPVENNNPDWLYIEYVPAVLCTSNMFLFTAAADVQTGLLAAGDILLGKLPTSTRDLLNRPISCDLAALVSQGGGNPNDVTPERARAAIAVAKAVLALWILISEYDYGVAKPLHPAAIDRRNGVIIVGDHKYPVHYIISQIFQSTGVSMAVAAQMWHYFVEILREGVVSVPGVRAKKPIGLSRAV